MFKNWKIRPGLQVNTRDSRLNLTGSDEGRVRRAPAVQKNGIVDRDKRIKRKKKEEGGRGDRGSNGQGVENTRVM